MPMKNPPHPGKSVLRNCLEPLGYDITTGAEALGVPPLALSDLVNAHSPISPDVAICLEKMGWSNAAHWLRLQHAYDLAQARLRSETISKLAQTMQGDVHSFELR